MMSLISVGLSSTSSMIGQTYSPVAFLGDWDSDGLDGLFSLPLTSPLISIPSLEYSLLKVGAEVWTVETSAWEGSSTSTEIPAFPPPITFSELDLPLAFFAFFLSSSH